jgi:hypothetical protein
MFMKGIFQSLLSDNNRKVLTNNFAIEERVIYKQCRYKKCTSCNIESLIIKCMVVKENFQFELLREALKETWIP